MAKVKIATTESQKMALIKECAERFNKKIKRNNRVRKTETDNIEKYNNISNIYAWTDASRYAEEYYGETLRNTTRYDNDWD